MSRSVNDLPAGDQKKDQQRDLAEITKLTPFGRKNLRGTRFKSGNMLGGASPLEAAPATEDPGEELQE